MLKSGEQRRYFRNRWEAAAEALRNFHAFGDTEELHELRVEIKKIRALLLLDENRFSGKVAQTHFKKVKKIFKNAGKVRSVQVNMELMEKYAVLKPETEKQQTSKLIQEAGKFHSDCDSYLRVFKKDPSRFLNGFASIKKNKLKKNIGKQIGKIEICFFENMQTGKLHDCRKKLKILYYQSGLFTEKLLDEIPLNRNYIKNLEKSIGEWHDTELVLTIAKRMKVENKTLERLDSGRKKQLLAIRTLSTDFRKKINRRS